MNSLFIAYLTWLIARFVWLKEGHRLTGRRFTGMVLFLLVAHFLIFENPVFAAALSVLLIGLSAILYFIERCGQQASPAARTVTLLVAIPLVYAVFVNLAHFHPQLDIFETFPTEWLALLTAALLCLKESNFAIRWFFRHYGLIEKVKALADAPSTENGRIIGNLERLLLLLFLWEGAALAATFIVAVKGLARFKKMEEHQSFAEYVIIGTFLSVLLTVLIFKVVTSFI
jgi:hypothetical protein